MFVRRIDPDEVQRLFNDGLTRKEIAARLGVTIKGVCKVVHTHRLREPNKLFRRWTPSELKRVSRMAAAGVPYAEIGRRMNRTTRSIDAVLCRVLRQSSPYLTDRGRHGVRTSEADVMRLAAAVLADVRKKYPHLDDDDRMSAVHLAAVEVMDANPDADTAFVLLVTAARRRAIDLVRSELGRTGNRIVAGSLYATTPDNDVLADTVPSSGDAVEAEYERRELNELVRRVRSERIAVRYRGVVREYLRQGSIEKAADVAGVCPVTFRKRLGEAFEVMKPHLVGCA